MATFAAASGSADERIQRTERRLIDAALAINEAPTLTAALDALARAGHELVDADRVSIVEWDQSLAGGTFVAHSQDPESVGRRVAANAAIRELLAAGTPFVVGPEHVDGMPADISRTALSFGTMLCIPLPGDGRAPASFQAAWDSPISDHDADVAISKLRLLGRLTPLASRAELQRRRAREEARLRTVLEAVPDGLVVRSDEEVIVNSAARALLASDSPGERIGLHDLEGREVPPDDTPMLRAQRTGESQSYVLRVTRYDGVQRVHEGTIAPITDDRGDVFATVTLFRDVTEQHERTWVARQLQQRLFDELPLPCSIVDPETAEVFAANKAFLELIGFDRAHVIGARAPYSWWADGAQRPATPAPGERTSTYEHLYRRADGTPLPVEVTRSVIRDASGAATAVLVVMTDLTERRSYEQQLIQSGKLASIGELAAGVAHEINNPLFAILGLVEFLLLDADPASKAGERLTLIQETALEIKEIVRALLDFARERSDERARISLRDVAHQTVELMRRTSSAKQVELIESYTSDDVDVIGSGNQLKQIFVNLVSNANQALKVGGGGTITIEVWRDGEHACACVRDDGPGMAPDVAAKIFEPFFTTKRDVGGTGLGLSVSFGIARAHGGSLTAHSEPERGAAFTLRLPIAREDAE